MCAFFSRVAVSVEIQAIADTRAAGGRKDRAWYPDSKPVSLPGFQIGGDSVEEQQIIPNGALSWPQYVIANCGFFLQGSVRSTSLPAFGSIVLVGDNHITRGSVFVIGGAPGVGKSRASVALAEAGATKCDWGSRPRLGLNLPLSPSR